MATLYANPYDTSLSGFYFDTLKQYEEKQVDGREYEIDYIDGSNPDLFRVARISQGNLDLWFENLDHISDDDEDGLKLRFLLESKGLNLDDALENMDDVNLYHGSLLDYATEYFHEIYDVPDSIRYYIDYEAFARDLEINDDVVEIDRDIYCINPGDF